MSSYLISLSLLIVIAYIASNISASSNIILTNELIPDEDIVTKEIESWKGFADSLKSEEDRKLFSC